MRRIGRALGIGAALLATAASARAQVPGVEVKLNPYIGYYHFDDSSFKDAVQHPKVNADPLLGARLDLGLLGWSVEFGYGRSSITTEGVAEGDIVYQKDATVQLFYAAANWHLPIPGPLDVFLSGGAGGIKTDPNTDVLVNYGIGASFPAGPVRIRADLKDHVDLCRKPDQVSDAGACFDDTTLHNIEISGGVEFGL